MDILVLGSGGREHAITVSLAASPNAGKIYVAPGNGGTALIAENISLDILDGDGIVSFAKEHGIGIVVIGPEAPLVAGVADKIRAAGIACFGPGESGARIEGSKTFAKHIMEENDLPTAAYGSFSNEDDALRYLETHHAPIVVKADGLAAGKGVTVAQTDDIAHDAVKDCFSGHFGEAGASVVIEEMLKGPECSMLAFVDGQHVEVMAPSQDHKRAYDGDQGPNTGGMGAYSPVPIVTDAEYKAMVDVMNRAVAGMRKDYIDYRGCLYGGFMLTANGPKLLEFNARFGDPETQVVLPRLKTDLLEVMLACDQGRLDQITLDWFDGFVVTVVLASHGYPGHYEKGKAITGIDKTNALDGVTVYHAGTGLDESGTLVTTGGRVLDVTAIGPDFESARNLAYKAAALIDFEGKQMRTDIGMRALRGRSAWDE